MPRRKKVNAKHSAGDHADGDPPLLEAPVWIPFTPTSLVAHHRVTRMPPPGLINYCEDLAAQKSWGQRMDYEHRLGVSQLLYLQCEPWHRRLAEVETHMTDYGDRVSKFLAALSKGMVGRFDDLLAECQSLTEQQRILDQELRTLHMRVSKIEEHILRLDIAERRRTLEWEAYAPPPVSQVTGGRTPSLFEEVRAAQLEAKELRSPNPGIWTPDHLRSQVPYSPL